MTDLKPCPFCGGEAEISLDHTVEENHAYGCMKCRIWFDKFNSENAEAEWNTRAAPPPDHLALVAAAYRDAADKCGAHSYSNNYFVSKALHDASTAILARTPADAEAHLTALLRAEYERGKAEAQVQGDTFYILEWMAGARPPVHPNPMRGRQSFRTPKEAIAFFKRQASDAQFLSLTKRVFLTEDCTPQALALLTQEGR